MSGAGSDNKIQIGCNIRQLSQFCQGSIPGKSRPVRAYLPNDPRLTKIWQD